MEHKSQYFIRRSLDTKHRFIEVELGIIDSFGQFHPEADLGQKVRDPDWLLMSQSDFESAARAVLATPLPQ